MSEITATAAARRFSDLLDAIEHGGESYVIMRRGRAVAHLAPVSTGSGADVRAMLARHRPDPAFADDVASTRALLEVEKR